MDKRQSDLLELGSYIQRVDKEVTMVLQSLQWDRKHLIQVAPMTSCKYNSHHRVPPDRVELHEKGCHLKSLGYSADEPMLPEPVDVHASTLVTLSKDDISNIIEYAAKIDPMFKKVFRVHCLRFWGKLGGQAAPLTLGRLQQAYSAEERRAIHDAVVGAVPACHDLGELALPSDDSGQKVQRAKTRAEILAELRDMKRRRTKYRVPAKSRNYSDVLRGVIATQMEHYSETSPDTAATEVRNDKKSKDSGNNTKEANNHRGYEEVRVKTEPVDEEDKKYSKGHERPSDKSKDRNRERGREKRYDDYRKSDRHRERDRYSNSSKERSKDRKEYRNDRPRRDDSHHSRRKEGRRRENKEYSKSKNSDRIKREREHDAYERSHKEHKYKSSYDFKDDSFESIRKRIKREKD